MRYLLQVHYAQRIITQKYPPYLNKFQFDPALLARGHAAAAAAFGRPRAEQLRLDT